MRGRDVGRVGNDDDDGRAVQDQPRERRAVAISGPAVQERTVGGQTAERLGRPGQRRPSERATSPTPPIAAGVPGVYVGRLEREHPEGDIETVAAQPVPVGAQQGVQRAEQRGQRRVPGGRFAAAAKPPSPPPPPAAAEHGQVAVGERDRPVADLAGGVERVAARLLRRRQDVVSALPDAPGPGVRAQLWRGPHSGRSHQARVPGGRGGALQPARRDRQRLRGRAHALPSERPVVVAQQQDAQPAQLPDDQLGVRAVRQPVQHARGTRGHYFRLREHRDGAPVAGC